MRLPLLIELPARIPTTEHGDHRKHTYKSNIYSSYRTGSLQEQKHVVIDDYISQH